MSSGRFLNFMPSRAVKALGFTRVLLAFCRQRSAFTLSLLLLPELLLLLLRLRELDVELEPFFFLLFFLAFFLSFFSFALLALPR